METLEKRKVEFIRKLSEEKIDQNIIDAFDHVDQQIFFDSIFKDKYYGNDKIPIGSKETSDDFIALAKMVNLLNPKTEDRILEIGTGSGYSTAILSLLCKEVVTIEIDEILARKAKQNLYKNNFENIRFFNGDATENDFSSGKINCIIMHAACSKRPFSLLNYLAENEMMVFPMGPSHMQQITSIEKKYNEKLNEPFIIKFFSYAEFSKIKGPYGYDTKVTPEIGDKVYVGKTIEENEKDVQISNKGLSKIKKFFSKK